MALVLFYDTEGRPRKVNIDDISGTLVSIDQTHHEIHGGNHFLYTDAVSLNDAGTQDYLITIPDSTKYIHMIFIMEGSAITQWQLFEGADRNGTTPQTVSNSNRNNTTAATLTIHKGTSGGSADGTQIHIYKGGSATNQSRSGSNTRNDEELILKRNTKYILRTTSGTNSNLTNIRLSWYEHLTS